jgi:alpha-tubulin suppressor-like RCC1 family protein
MRAFRWSTPIAVVLALAGCGDDDHGSGNGGAGGADASGIGGAGGGGNAGTGGLGGGGSVGSGGTGGTTADGIIVDTPSGRLASESTDGFCDILEAVAAANAGQSVRECANPNRSMRIILSAGASYPTGKTLRFDTAVPDRQFKIGIADGTTGTATISAAAGWLLDPGDPPTSCLVHASQGVSLALSDVTLDQAPSLRLSGACLTRGALDVRRARVTGFRRSGVVATCLPESGCDYANDGEHAATLRVMNSLVDGNSTAGDGGGIYSAGAAATVLVFQSAIVNNAAEGGGGGIYFGGGWNTDIIQASTVSGNTANVGGGIMVKFFCSNTYVNIFNSTIANNIANATGGGIEFQPADRSCATQDVSVYGSVVAGNHSATTPESNINAGWWTDNPAGNLGIFNCYGGSFIYVAPGHPLPTQPDRPCVFDARDARLGPLMPMGGVGDLPAHPLLAGSAAIDAAGDMSVDDQRDGWIMLLDPPPAVDWRLFDRLADGNGDGTAAADLGAIEMSGRWQTELLAVAAKGQSAHTVVTQPLGYDRGAGTQYAAADANNQLVTYRLPISEPGDYDLSIGLLTAPDAGRFQIAIAGSLNGPWTDVGPVQDGYGAAPVFAAFGPFALPKIATAGVRLVRLTVAGRNSASAGYKLSLDYIDARKSTTPCPVAQIALGRNHTCALTAGGGVRCWGANDAGQLGDGTTMAVWRAPALDALPGVKVIATGDRHTCVLTTAGGVRCWGANDAGQLGDGTNTPRSTPPNADVLTDAAALAAGDRHTCVLTTAGGVRCWGANDAGQLGDGTNTPRSTPPNADVLTGVKAVAAGGSVTCALMLTGGVRCWGANHLGQLGDGTAADRATPPATDVITSVAALSVASGHTCVVTTAGGVRCWGHNGNGELGDGTYVDTMAPPATDVLAGARDVAAASNFTCATTATGGERCWGANDIGQLGDDTDLSVDRMTPGTTDNLGGVRAVAVGAAHTCALMTGGGVRCWGANGAGQLGDGLAPDFALIAPSLDIAGFTGTCR